MTALPFLYCTRSLLSTYSKQGSLVYRACASTHRVCVASARNAHTLERRWEDDIPSDDPTPHSRQVDPNRSTLTPYEKSVFERIAKEREIIGAREEDSRLSTNDIDLNDPYDDLNVLFDAAIHGQELREQEIKASIEKSRVRYTDSPYLRAIDDLPLTAGDQTMLNKGFWRPLHVKDGQIVENGVAERTDDGTREACSEHRVRVKRRLESTETDVEIWNILETEVFCMVKLLNQQMEKEQQPAKTARRARGSRARVRAGNPTSGTIERASNSTDWTADQILPRLLGESKALTSNHILSLLQENYAYLNLLALRLWRRRHPSTPYSLRLLPQIKSMGKVSYVLGASTGLYNEILYVKWTQYHDLHGIADLLLEMINQGLGVNHLSYELLCSIDRTRTKDLAGKRGRVLRSWWRLRGINEAWTRVRQIYKEVEQEMEQSQQGESPMIEPEMVSETEGLQAALNAQDDGSVHEPGLNKLHVTKEVWGDRHENATKRPAAKGRALKIPQRRMSRLRAR